MKLDRRGHAASLLQTLFHCAKLSRRRPLKTVNYLALNSDKMIRRDLLFFSLSSLIRFFKSHRRARERSDFFFFPHKNLRKYLRASC